MPDLVVDLSRPGAPFPPIHEGRYEVDPETQGLTPPDPVVVAGVREAGVRLLRVGVGIWLPSKDPDPATHPEREWFRGSTTEDVEDPSLYEWTHIDRNLAACRDLGVELLLSVDYMPATLAGQGGPSAIPPEILVNVLPEGYEFPDGVRNAPPRDPAVFAAATVKLLEHVVAQGITIRYVELWNEPDLPIFFAGNYDDYIRMYRAFAPAVSTAGFAVGGTSFAGANPELWLHRFVDDVVAESLPLDFFSFHRYPKSAREIVDLCVAVRAKLDSAGLTATKAVIDEWGWELNEAEFYGTAKNPAFTAACLMRMPAVGIADQTHILLVDPVPPDLGRFHGIVRQDGDRNPIWFAIEWFERFQATNRRLPTEGYEWSLAGTDGVGQRCNLLLSNPTDDSVVMTIEARGGAVIGDARRFSQQTFDEEGGWGPPEPVKLGPDAVAITLAPWSLLAVEGERTAP